MKTNEKGEYKMTEEKLKMIEKQMEEGVADMMMWDKEDRIAEFKRLINLDDTEVSPEEKEVYKELLKKELD